jgi:transcriptional regulator
VDSKTRETLLVIEGISASLSVVQRGNQLIHIVKDYLQAGENDDALRVLAKIDMAYFDEHMYEEAALDQGLAESIADIIEMLGLGFSVLARPRSYLC